jgi:hypothetical protein
MFNNSKKRCISLVVFMLVILIGAAWYLTHLCLFVETVQGTKLVLFTRQGESVKLRYIHSVHKTPVFENFVVKDNFLLLESTEYESYGVGLPFLPEEGEFQQVGDKFILRGLARHFPKVVFLMGPETKVAIYYENKIFPLYEYYPVGTAVTIRVGPYYSRWLRYYY